jgi:type I restriction enzyme M protein
VKANVVFFDAKPKDGSLDNLDDLPSPDILQQEIIDHLEAALAAFRDVAAALPSFNAKE